MKLVDPEQQVRDRAYEVLDFLVKYLIIHIRIIKILGTNFLFFGTNIFTFFEIDRRVKDEQAADLAGRPPPDQAAPYINHSSNSNTIIVLVPKIKKSYFRFECFAGLMISRYRKILEGGHPGRLVSWHRNSLAHRYTQVI